MTATRTTHAAPFKYGTRMLAASLLTLALGGANTAHAQQTTQVWGPRTITTLEDEQFNSMDFANADTGYALGKAGAIYRTVDKGETWTALPKPAAAGTSLLLKLDFVNGRTGWVVGNGGVIVKTTDAGATWTAQTSGSTRNLYLLQFLDDTHGWAQAESDSLLRTTNGGQTWTRHYVPNQAPLNFAPYAMHFVTRDSGFVVGAQERIYRSVDGGVTWTNLTNFALSNPRDLYAVRFVTPRIGWVAGGTSAYISKTTDGGITWTTQPPGAFPGGLKALSFVDTLTGWAVGHGGTLLKTINGGTTWLDQDFADQFVDQVGFGEPFAHVQALGVNDAVAMSYRLFIKTPGGNTSIMRSPSAGTPKNRPTLALQGTSTVRYALPFAAQQVRLDFLDLQGRVVTTLVNGARTAGIHVAALDARKVPAGIYTLRLSVGRESGAGEALHRIVITR